MQAVLAHLGIGPMSAYTQADTLEDEVDNYLASQDESVDIIEFWQVSRDGLLC